MMDNLLYEFWAWMGMSRHEYAHKAVFTEFEEYMFPKWPILMEETLHAISCEDICAIPDILEVMALDNEAEHILDFLCENASHNFLNIIYGYLPSCIFHHARWQGAALIQRIPTATGLEVLKILLSDESAYVRKRAQNAYSAIKGE